MARHYGIPYMGSKQKLVDKIVPFILNRHPDITDFYDLFGGGGSVALYVVRKHPEIKVHYNELSTAIGGLMQHLKDGGELNMQWVTREEFNKLKDGNDYKAGLMQTVWSFGNKTDATYLYGKNIQDFKHELHKSVVEGALNFNKVSEMANEILLRDYNKNVSTKFFINSKRYSTPYQRRIVAQRQIDNIGHLQHIGRTERLMQIQNMPGINDLLITTGTGYDEIKISGHRPIIYCDPPYESTTEYAEGGFNSKAFYDWAMQQPYPVYVSSYKISDTRLKLLRSVKTRSLLDQKTRDNKHYNYENLYWNGVE